MTKLPRYVFRRANGSYRYKRNVPKAIVPLLGKRTIYRQLGRTYAEAMKLLPYVHVRIEGMFEVEKQKTDRERALEAIRAMAMSDHELIALAGRLQGALPAGVPDCEKKRPIIEEAITLNRVLDDYLAYKAIDGAPERDLVNRVERLRREMQHLYGKTRLDVTPIAEITRQDVNELRDLLLGKMSPNSAQRVIGIIKAAMNLTITEQGLNIPNMFARLRIKGAGASRSDRLPIGDKQLDEVLPAFTDKHDTHALFITLADTGARLAEVAGLEARDVDVENGVLYIRPNGVRDLKTRSSERSIPLSRRATELLRESRLVLSDGDPIFRKYARPRGSDAASAMLMKRLRTVVSDRKVTIHSLRHRMKDKLRNSGCPEALSMEILGHSQGTVAANYGSGYAIDVMREAMKQVWME